MANIKYPHVTKKIAAQLINKEIGSAVGLVSSETQTPGGRYEALRGRLYITIEANWMDGDPKHFVVTLTDSQGGTIRHYYHADTLEEDMEMEDVSRYENRLENALDILESTAQLDQDYDFIEILSKKIRKVRCERKNLQFRAKD